MSAISFRTVLELHGATATGLPVPEDVVERLGGGKRVPVRVTLRVPAGPYTYLSTVAPRGGQYLVPVSAEHRLGAGLAAGDEVDVELVLDASPRDVVVPAVLADALAAAPGAADRFAALSASARKRHVLAVEGAKTEATRERRIAAVIDELSGR